MEHPDRPVLIDTAVGLDHEGINELYSPVHHDLDAALAGHGIDVSDITTIITSTPPLRPLRPEQSIPARPLTRSEI
jgi:hypothetical protein